MIINFILPCLARNPIGGFKVVYEYSNRFALNGNIVNLIHPLNIEEPKKVKPILKSTIINFLSILTKRYSSESWYRFKQNVNCMNVPYLHNKYVPNGDVLIATSWETASPVLKCDKDKGRKFYFIQSFESWSGDETLVMNTWKLPLKKIVISKWLKKIADEIGEEAVYIPNSIDKQEFFISKPIDERSGYDVMMLYHDMPVKGTEYALRALENFKKLYPQLKLTLFGVSERPSQLSQWINYYSKPSRAELNSLFNSNAVFISPSFVEGFPLPPAEAMSAGCCVLASEIEGHMEYCYDGKTALLFEPGKEADLIRKLEILLLDNKLRQTLAVAGNSNILKYDFEDSSRKFEELLTSMD